MIVQQLKTEEDFERQVKQHVEEMETQHVLFKTNDIPRLGKISGFHNVPTLSELKSTTLEVPEITAFYDLLSSSKQMFLKKLSNLSDTGITERLHDIESEKKVLKNKCFSKEDEHDSISITRSPKLYKIYRIFIVGISVTEMFFITSVMTFFGDNPLVVFAMAVPISLGIIEYFKSTTLYLRDTPYVPKWCKIVLVFIGICIFIVVAVLRREQVRLNSIESGTQLSDVIYNPFVFAVLSAVPAMATIFIVFTYYLSLAERKLLERKNELTKEITTCKNQLNSLSNQQLELNSQQITLAHLDNALSEYDVQLDNKIHAFKKQSLAAFVRENLNNRSDHESQH